MTSSEETKVELEEITAWVIDSTQAKQISPEELQNLKDTIGSELQIEHIENGGLILYATDAETQQRLAALFKLFRHQKIYVDKNDTD